MSTLTQQNIKQYKSEESLFEGSNDTLAHIPIRCPVQLV